MKYLLITSVMLSLLLFNLSGFGKVATGLSIVNNPFQYSGAYTDCESALQYLNARYYEPTFSRFISRDSYRLLNRYSYVDGNPIMYSDPSGHEEKLATGIFLATNIILGLGALGDAATGLHAASKKISYAPAFGLTAALAITATVINFLAWQTKDPDQQKKLQSVANGLMIATAGLSFFVNPAMAEGLESSVNQLTAAERTETSLVSQVILARRLNALSIVFQLSSLALGIAYEASKGIQQQLQDSTAALLGLSLMLHGLAYRQTLKLSPEHRLLLPS